MDENKNIEKPKQKKNHNKSGVMKLLSAAGIVAGVVVDNLIYEQRFLH